MNTVVKHEPEVAPPRKSLRMLHFLGTLWFILCVGYIMVISLRQAGFNWWVIFSLSGHTLVVLLFLVSLYLFALFRSSGASPTYAIEHPLTSTDCYKALYVSSPFLGGLAACVPGVTDSGHWSQFLNGLSLGTFGTTFIMWVVVDPFVSVVETFAGASRRCRRERLARQRALRQAKQKQRDDLLQRVIDTESENHRQWRDSLEPYAAELSTLIQTDERRYDVAQKKGIELGVRAWQIGGLPCMRYLHEMTMDKAAERQVDTHARRFLSVWWDGVGSWRDPLLG